VTTKIAPRGISQTSAERAHGRTRGGRQIKETDGRKKEKEKARGVHGKVHGRWGAPLNIRQDKGGECRLREDEKGREVTSMEWTI